MPNDRPAPLDLLALAEDVAAGRRALDNVIDQIAVSIPDDRARRRAVAELGSLVLALTGVRAHARATVEAATRGARAAPPARGGGGAGRGVGLGRRGAGRPRRAAPRRGGGGPPPRARRGPPPPPEVSLSLPGRW